MKGMPPQGPRTTSSNTAATYTAARRGAGRRTGSGHRPRRPPSTCPTATIPSRSGTHAGVHDNNEYSGLREILKAKQKHACRGHDVTRRNAMGNINNGRTRIDAEYRGLHASHEVVGKAEIGDEGDRGHI